MIAWLRQHIPPVLPHQHSFSDSMRVESRQVETIYPGVFRTVLVGEQTCLKCGESLPHTETYLTVPWWPDKHLVPTDSAWLMIYTEIGAREINRWQAERCETHTPSG